MTELKNKTADVVFVSTADWDNPYWTNKQHVAIQLAKRGYKIFYVESQGLRSPTATARDAKRIFGKIKKGLRTPRKVRENLYVWCPLTIPFQKYQIVRHINRLILNAGVNFWTKILGLKKDVFWTYSPMSTAFYDLNGYKAVIYHSVDDIKAQPGMPAKAIEKFEIDLLKKADVVFVTAPSLYDAHSLINKNVFYHSNVADFDHFNSATNDSLEIPEDVRALKGPVVGFIGAISSYKLDFLLIKYVAELRPDINFLLIGEVGEGDPNTNVEIFEKLSNVRLLGGRPYKELPAYLKKIDVALLPNKINDYTKAMFPMKFFEYLAAGKPVVSTELPALIAFTEVADFCNNYDDFLAAIDRRLVDIEGDVERRLKVARKYTYEYRTDLMLEILKKKTTGL